MAAGAGGIVGGMAVGGRAVVVTEGVNVATMGVAVGAGRVAVKVAVGVAEWVGVLLAVGLSQVGVRV